MIDHIRQLWVYIKQLWANGTVRQIVIPVITAIVSSLFTHAFDGRKLRKQQEIAFQESLGKIIVDAYLKVRETISQLEIIEALPESIELSQENKRKAEELVFYPAIMEDIQTLARYGQKVSNIRQQYETYLSNKASSFLYVLERYLLEVAAFIGNNSLQNATKRVGILVHPDLQKIKNAFNDVIIHEINKPRYYLESKNTWRYKLTKTALKKKYIDHSVLMGILDKDITNTISHINSEKDKHES